mmetsp:Transcript_36645/g.80159  ORF Transcript_36645/g.80159 Transcript_36645/m.80159 type:complete len:219 (-) Transcript_36645:3314-3970(-)
MPVCLSLFVSVGLVLLSYNTIVVCRPPSLSHAIHSICCTSPTLHFRNLDQQHSSRYSCWMCFASNRGTNPLLSNFRNVAARTPSRIFDTSASEKFSFIRKKNCTTRRLARQVRIPKVLTTLQENLTHRRPILFDHNVKPWNRILVPRGQCDSCPSKITAIRRYRCPRQWSWNASSKVSAISLAPLLAECIATFARSHASSPPLGAYAIYFTSHRRELW